MQFFLVPCKRSDDQRTGCIDAFGLGAMEFVIPNDRSLWHTSMSLVVLTAYEPEDEGAHTAYIALVDSKGQRVPTAGATGQSGDGLEYAVNSPRAAGGHAQAFHWNRISLHPGVYRWQVIYRDRIAASWPFLVRVQEPGEVRKLLEGEPADR